MTTRVESPPIALDGAQAPSQYTRTAMVLHWTIAVLMIGNAALGLSADSLSDGWVRPVIDTHKSIGITVLGLALMRILWRVSHRPPPLPREFPSWERVAAHVAHFLLYLLMIALPLSGWAHDSAWKDALTHPMRLFNLFPWPRIGFVMNLDPSVKEPLHTGLGTLHTWLGYALYALLAMHIGGALKHQWLDRQSVFKRMAP